MVRTASILLSSAAPGEYESLYTQNAAVPEQVPEQMPEPVVTETESITVAETVTAAENLLLNIEMSKADEDLSDEIRLDLVTLNELVLHLEDNIASGYYVSDEEVAAISHLISRIKLKYSVP